MSDNVAFQRNLHDGYKGKYQAETNARILIRTVKKYVRDGILDIGAANGALLEQLDGLGFKDLKGIDLVPKSKRVIQGSITDLPFEDGTFYTVFCTEVVEHLDKGQMFKGLKEIKRVLKKDGCLILTVPHDEDFSLNMVTCPDCGKEFHRWGHVQRFSRKDIGRVLTKNGHSIIFEGIYAFGAMSKLPLGSHLNWLFKRFDYDFLQKSIVVVARKKR